MADDTGGTGPLPRGKGPDPEFQNVMFQLTAAEKSIFLAGVVIVVVNLIIGDVFLNDFGLSNATWLIALATTAAIYFFYAGEHTFWHDWYPWIAEKGAWAIGLIGVFNLIGSLTDGIPSSGATLFFQIVFWAAAGFAIFGAIQIRQQG
jgi:hypothetical protein